MNCSRRLVLATALLTAIGLAAQSRPTEITVSAAASLQNALNEITAAFERASPAVTVHLNFGASGTLMQQIEQGAPVDVFISAAPEQMDKLAQQQMIRADTRHELLKNSLVLVVPASGGPQIGGFSDLTNPSIKFIAIGEPQTVPAGKYAQQVLMHFGIYDRLKAKFVFGKDVRSVLTYVSSGNADAGIVYATDAKTTSQVRIAATAPDISHDPVVYPVAVLKDTKSEAAAKSYENFLSSSAARTVFRKYGFAPEN